MPAGVPPVAGGVGVGVGVAAALPAPPPAQPAARARIATHARMSDPGVIPAFLRSDAAKLRQARMAAIQSQGSRRLGLGITAVLRAVEVMDTCALTLPPLGLTEPGETLHPAAVGAPLQVKATV